MDSDPSTSKSAKLCWTDKQKKCIQCNVTTFKSICPNCSKLGFLVMDCPICGLECKYCSILKHIRSKHPDVNAPVAAQRTQKRKNENTSAPRKKRKVHSDSNGIGSSHILVHVSSDSSNEAKQIVVQETCSLASLYQMLNCTEQFLEYEDESGEWLEIANDADFELALDTCVVHRMHLNLHLKKSRQDQQNQ